LRKQITWTVSTLKPIALIEHSSKAAPWWAMSNSLGIVETTSPIFHDGKLSEVLTERSTYLQTVKYRRLHTISQAYRVSISRLDIPSQQNPNLASTNEYPGPGRRPSFDEELRAEQNDHTLLHLISDVRDEKRVDIESPILFGQELGEAKFSGVVWLCTMPLRPWQIFKLQASRF
jgi:hypothetical protein